MIHSRCLCYVNVCFVESVTPIIFFCLEFSQILWQSNRRIVILWLVAHLSEKIFTIWWTNALIMPFTNSPPTFITPKIKQTFYPHFLVKDVWLIPFFVFTLNFVCNKTNTFFCHNRKNNEGRVISKQWNLLAFYRFIFLDVQNENKAINSESVRRLMSNYLSVISVWLVDSAMNNKLQCRRHYRRCVQISNFSLFLVFRWSVAKAHLFRVRLIKHEIK